jgi:hypothetical protein
MADNELPTIDKVAEMLHNTWWKLELDKGFTLGPRDEAGKRHPHLIPWSAKTERERAQDYYQAVRVLLLLRENREADNETIGQRIEDALVEFRKAVGSSVASNWDENRARKERLAKAQALREMIKKL